MYSLSLVSQSTCLLNSSDMKSARLGSNAWFLGGCESQILDTEELGYLYGHAEK